MTLHLWLAGYRDALQQQGHTFLDSIIAQDFFYEHDKGILKYPEINFEQLVEDARAYVFSHLEDLQLYPGAVETIASLDEHTVRLSLVSSSSRQLVEAGLTKFNLLHYFDSIICGDDVTKHKPDPEAFRQTLENVGMLPHETLIIGDARTDILAGKAAGTYTCLFTPADNALFYDFTELRAAEPDYCISTLADVLSIMI